MSLWEQKVGNRRADRIGSGLVQLPVIQSWPPRFRGFNFLISNTTNRLVDISGFPENSASFHIHNSDSEFFDEEPWVKLEIARFNVASTLGRGATRPDFRTCLICPYSRGISSLSFWVIVLSMDTELSFIWECQATIRTSTPLLFALYVGCWIHDSLD